MATIREDIIRIAEAGLQVVLDKDGDTFVAKAVCTGRTVAKGASDKYMDDAISELVTALIALNGPKAASQDDMLAKVFS